MKTRRHVFVPATISNVSTYVAGELRKITLCLPPTHEVDGTLYPIRDRMRPGTAFLVRPFGLRTGKVRRRMYTRSNESGSASGVLETIINRSENEKADTSTWWQTAEIDRLHNRGGTVDIGVDLIDELSELVVYENSQNIERNNLRLESDDAWPSMRILALAFSTGVTPFLAYIRYMQRLHFGKTANGQGVQVMLIVSVRSPDFLMEHQELQELAQAFPEHVQYIPVCTRKWSEGWTGPTGRIIRVTQSAGPESRIDLSPLQALVPDLSEWHIRVCGSADVRNQLVRGLDESDIHPISFRAEVW